MKSNRILKNTGSLMVFNIAKILFPFITLPYLTRVLSTGAYGTVAYVKTVMTYMQIVVDFGFVLSGTKEIVNTRNDKKKMAYVVGDIMFARVLLSLGAFVILGIFIVALPILRNHILYTVLSYVVVVESVFLMDFLFRGLEIMHVITIRFILMKFVSTILTFFLVKSDADILLIPLFDILGSFLAVLLVFHEVKKIEIKVKFNGIKQALASIKESFVYFLSNVAATSFNAISTLVIGMLITTTEVAYWSVCMQVAGSIQACYTAISDGIYPEMIKCKKFSIIKKTLNYVMPVITVGCIAAYFLADFGMMILGGSAYLAAAPIFRLLIPILFFDLPAVLFGWPALGGIGKAKEVTISTVASIMVNIVLLGALIVTGSFTLVNIAIVRSVTEIPLFLIRFGFCWKYRSLFENE